MNESKATQYTNRLRELLVRKGATPEQAQWIIDAHDDLTDYELGKCIGADAVAPFRSLCAKITALTETR